MNVRRWIAITAAVGVGLAISGCGSSSGDSTASGGDCAQSVKLGLLATLSGPGAALGELTKNGAELAVSQANEAGDVCIDLVVKDDAGDPTKASQATRELVDQEEVDAVAGPLLTGPTGAALPITTPAKIVSIVTSSAKFAGDPTEFPYTFQVTSQSGTLADAYVAYMKDHGLTKAAALVVNNEFGTDLLSEFKRASEGTDIELVSEETFVSGSVDAAPQVSKMKASGADTFLNMLAVDPDHIAAIKARNSLDWDVPMLGVQSIANASIPQAVGADGMAKVYAVGYRNLASDGTAGVPSSPLAATFKTDYMKATGAKTLDGSFYMAASTYDAVNLLVAAYKETGETDSDAVKDYLASATYDGVAASYEFSSDNHNGITVEDLTFVDAGAGTDGIMPIAG
ncbi:hypothetical protein GCM10023350_09120 [Nocardioides endophyticus]|uniref:Leucine-binding protein domain-containing protein n=1 Tax=Nocardioides endophyticus TaxID=1353775 RepID=A0ABP8YET2_9ACTN